jgi:hypothetical protein
VQGDFTPHQYTPEEGKQGSSLEVNVAKFSLAGRSKAQENGKQSGSSLDDPYCAY